jgi:hypothetical protein
MLLAEAKLQLENIILKYKQYEDLTPSKPPPIGNYFSPAYGFLRLVENQGCYESLFYRNVYVGINIGSKFANYDYKLVSTLKSEIKDVLKHLDGRILDVYGSAFTTVGVTKD